MSVVRAGITGAPALFDRTRWHDLVELTGDQGAGRLLRNEATVAIAWTAGTVDVDTPQDLAALTTAISPPK